MVDSSNGMQTRCWGPPLWFSLHILGRGFPVKPSNFQRKQYLAFFRSLGHVLPCVYCRDSYAKFTAARGKTPLTMRVMKDRRSLSLWLYKLHNAVNDRLGVHKRPTFEAVCRKYERFRAHTCSDSSKIKASSNRSHRCTGKKGFRRRVKLSLFESA